MPKAVERQKASGSLLKPERAVQYLAVPKGGSHEICCFNLAYGILGQLYSTKYKFVIATDLGSCVVAGLEAVMTEPILLSLMLPPKHGGHAEHVQLFSIPELPSLAQLTQRTQGEL